jgi:hypothetical protein
VCVKFATAVPEEQVNFLNKVLNLYPANVENRVSS